MSNYFSDIETIPYQGATSQNPLSYRYYDANKIVLGKSMAEHLRLAVCMWHTFCWEGNDNFGANTFHRPWLQSYDPMQCAKDRVAAAFEFIAKLGVPFFTFHDRDIAPEGTTLKESNHNAKVMTETIANHMQRTGIQLLWGTANLFSHPRYMAGAATNPNPDIFAYACAQVKTAMDMTQQLNGANYVLWGGREGYDTLLNTNLEQEVQQLGRFLSLLVDYKHKIGFKGTLLIEPKPCEPTKHQYDFDSAHVYALLQRFHLEKEFKVNIEANHATLAGHGFANEVAYASSMGIFGSVDANRGDPQLGWDTDQFPLDLYEMTRVLYIMLEHGGFTTGGFNFDTKLRRQSIDATDLFFGHICGIDTLARALLCAAKLITEKNLAEFRTARYADWKNDFAQSILTGKIDLAAISDKVLTEGVEPQPVSGRQELLENLVNNAI